MPKCNIAAPKQNHKKNPKPKASWQDPNKNNMIQQWISAIFLSATGRKLYVCGCWEMHFCGQYFECYTERKGEKEHLMSYLPQKLCVLMITRPLTLTLAMARSVGGMK